MKPLLVATIIPIAIAAGTRQVLIEPRGIGLLMTTLRLLAQPARAIAGRTRDERDRGSLRLRAHWRLCAVSGRTAWRRERSSTIRIHDVEAL
jgi:hypothetical protein